jgi:hypothetical protein
VLLVAALELETEPAAVRPGHARQINVGIVAEVDPALLARGHGHDPQTQLHVGPARRGIALLDRRHAIGVDLAARDEVHGRFIDLDKRHVPLVRGPPVAGQAVHFLLRHEFGHAILDRSATVPREAQLASVAQIDGVDILVPYERDVASVGRAAHVRLEGPGPRELRHLPRGEVVTKDVAGEGKEQGTRVLGPGVLHDAAPEDALALAPCLFLVRQGLLTGHEQLRVDEAARAPVTDVILPEVVALVVVLPIAQEGDPAAIRRVLEGPRRGA